MGETMVNEAPPDATAGEAMTGASMAWGDKRGALRQRTLKRGRVLVNGVEVATGTVRNMSLTGARLVSPDVGCLPDRFTLSIGDEGLAREVEVMSRTSTGAGVRFTRPLDAHELGPGFLQPGPAEGRSPDPATQRAELLARAREGLSRMALGFEAPSIEMPDAIGNADDAGDADGEVKGGTMEVGTGEVEEGAASVVAPVPTDPPSDDDAVAARPATVESDDDEIEDEDDVPLTRLVPADLPRRIRRALPWRAALTRH